MTQANANLDSSAGQLIKDGNLLREAYRRRDWQCVSKHTQSHRLGALRRRPEKYGRGLASIGRQVMPFRDECDPKTELVGECEVIQALTVKRVVVCVGERIDLLNIK